MTINSLTGMLETAGRLGQLRIQAIEAEQELLEYTRRQIRTELGQDAEGYLSGKAVEILSGRPEGIVRERALLSALEYAYRTGAFRARGGVPGPAPVQYQPGTPAWLHHLAIGLEDALARFGRKFEDNEKASLRATAATLLLMADETEGKDSNGAG